MTTKEVALRLFLGPVLALASCAVVDPREDFQEVQRTSSERGLPSLVWRADVEADKQAKEVVRDILSRDLDADSAVRLALLENRELQAVYEELGIGRGLLVQASRPRNPVFDAEYRFTDGGGAPGIHLSIVQEFLSLLFLPLRRSLAALELEAGRLRVTAAVLELAGEVRRTFYLLQAAEQEREMRERIVQATNASYDLASRLHAAGNFRDLDLDNERALYEQAKLDLARAEAETARAREHLNGLMGLWGEQTAWCMGKRLPEPPGEMVPVTGLESRAIERSLDLEIAQREFQAEAQRLGIQRATLVLPELNVGVAGEREPVDGTWSVGPSLSLPLPLFNQGQGTLAIALAALRQREQRYGAIAVEIRAEVRSVASDLLTAQSRARYYREVMLPLRSRIVAATQLEYNAMQVGAFQLLQAKRDEIEAGSRYIEVLRDYWFARTDLDQLQNGGRASKDRLGGDSNRAMAERGQGTRLFQRGGDRR